MDKEPDMSPDNIKKLYMNLVNDIEFDQLELLNNDLTFFEIIGASNAELRHSNFLAWILNPNASHGLGESFLKRFIREMVSDSRALNVSEIEIEELDFSDVVVLREWNNIDLLIEFDTIVFAIENKILSKEHSKQLTRYRNIVTKEFKNKKHVFVYLTPFCDDSVDESETYVSIGYDAVVDILERIMEVRGDTLGYKVRIYISDYLKTLKKQVMGTDESVDLARRIYKNHKELLDFIITNKPDNKQPVIDKIEQILSDEGWKLTNRTRTGMRFTTDDLHHVMPAHDNKDSWSGKESFQFEFLFQSDKYIAFIATISPGIYADKMKDLLLDIEGAKEPTGRKWFTFFNTKMNIKYEKISEMKEGEIDKKINAFMIKVKEVVLKVESQLLKHIDEIRNE